MRRNVAPVPKNGGSFSQDPETCLRYTLILAKIAKAERAKNLDLRDFIGGSGSGKCTILT